MKVLVSSAVAGARFGRYCSACRPLPARAPQQQIISTRHENLALRIITIGMAVFGVTTASERVDHLVTHSAGRADLAGIVLAGLSVIVLAGLSKSKRGIAPHIPSRTLSWDGWLLATGSILALVTLAGTPQFEAFSWWWLNLVASLMVARGVIDLGYS